MHTKPDYSKKESFVNFLLDHYAPPSPEKGEGLQLSDLQSNMRLLLQRVSTLSEEVAVIRQSQSAGEQTKVLDLVSRMSALHESIYTHVFPLLTREREAPPVVHEAARFNEQMLTLYEHENVRLKQENMALIRSRYAQRFSDGGRAQTDDERVSHGKVTCLLNQVKDLEERKAELMRDNVELNRLSQEILDENRELKRAMNNDKTP